MEFLGGCHLFEAERLLEKIPYFYSLILTLLISDMFDQLQKHNSYITFNRESFHIILHLDLSIHQSQILVKLRKLFKTE